MTDAAPPTRWAFIYFTKTFIYVGARSGYWQNYADPKRYSGFLDPGAPDVAVGKAILEALSRSRFLNPTWNRNFFQGATTKATYEALVDELMRRYGFKTKKQLFDKMAFVHVKQQKGRITFRPHRWAKPEYWSDLDEDQDVVIPETKNAEAVGAAWRQALSRCS